VASVRISYGSEPFPNSRPLHRALPQLFIHGSRDETFPVADSVRAFDDASGTRFLVVLAGAKHTPFRTAAGQTIGRVATNFLDAVLKHRPGALDALLRDVRAKGVPGRADSTP
jgi:pimeloyl-ACP methyl ester carboxylesterase